jgi:hypothetical protein
MTGMAEPGPDALLDFGRSIDPISTNGADYAPQFNTRPTKFSDLAPSLYD